VSTRSNIARENEDGSYDLIYCHWDGYPSNNGRILHEYYQDPAKIDELLKLGDLSNLGPQIGTKHDFEDRPDGECTAYGRDRGERNTESKHYTKKQLIAMLKKSWTEWLYVYSVKDKKWYYTNNPSPTWFKCCGPQRKTEELTPKAWEEK
jgi:hypothetical protein